MRISSGTTTANIVSAVSCVVLWPVVSTLWVTDAMAGKGDEGGDRRSVLSGGNGGGAGGGDGNGGGHGGGGGGSGDGGGDKGDVFGGNGGGSGGGGGGWEGGGGGESGGTMGSGDEGGGGGNGGGKGGGNGVGGGGEGGGGEGGGGEGGEREGDIGGEGGLGGTRGGEKGGGGGNEGGGNGWHEVAPNEEDVDPSGHLWHVWSTPYSPTRHSEQTTMPESTCCRVTSTGSVSTGCEPFAQRSIETVLAKVMLSPVDG